MSKAIPGVGPGAAEDPLDKEAVGEACVEMADGREKYNFMMWCSSSPIPSTS